MSCTSTRRSPGLHRGNGLAQPGRWGWLGDSVGLGPGNFEWRHAPGGSLFVASRGIHVPTSGSGRPTTPTPTTLTAAPRPARTESRTFAAGPGAWLRVAARGRPARTVVARSVKRVLILASICVQPRWHGNLALTGEGKGTATNGHRPVSRSGIPRPGRGACLHHALDAALLNRAFEYSRLPHYQARPASTRPRSRAVTKSA